MTLSTQKKSAAPALFEDQWPRVLLQQWRWVLGIPCLAALIALGISFLISPTYSATVAFLPPQQQNSSAAALLSTLGPLAGVAAASNIKSPADQYVALMRSVTVGDRMVERFNLMQVYDEKYRIDARKELDKNVQINIGKKDGLISVTVDDHDRQKAADMANQYVEELRRMTNLIALSEAQQRRVFFEKRLQEIKVALTAAQTALQDSGFTAGALKAEPKAAADVYAKLRAELTGAEVKLQTLRNSLTENAPQVRQQIATVQALKTRLRELEQSDQLAGSSSDYIGKYREFKYQETLFEIMSKQYEMARIDESREGALIQVVDVAAPAEKKTRPKRLLITLAAALGAGMLTALLLIMRLIVRDLFIQNRQNMA